MVIAACFASAIHAANTAPPSTGWPEFRGASQQGNFDCVNVPAAWGSEDNLRWRTPIPGTGWSQPIVQGDRIFLTTAVPEGEARVDLIGDSKRQDIPISLRVICVDLASGRIVWTTEVDRVPENTPIHPKNSHASPTPCVANNRIFFHFGPHGTGAVGMDGRIIWKKRISYEPQHGSGGSPLVVGNSLILNCDGSDQAFVVALATSDGTEIWRTSRPDTFGAQSFSFSTPLLIDVAGKPQVVSPGSHVVQSFDPKDGTELWRVRYPERFSVIPRPVFVAGLVCVCTGYEGPPEIVAIRPNGSGDVTETHIAWRRKGNVPHTPSPAVGEDCLFLVADAGIATCRELTKGNIIWAERLGGNFSASPIISKQFVYFVSEEGTCTVIKAAQKFEIVATNELGERTLASPVPIEGGLLIRTEAALYRIGR